MRVLLVGTNAARPDDGGGYTLSRDITTALIAAAPASHHQFFVQSNHTEQGSWPSHVTRLFDRRPFTRRASQRAGYVLRRAASAIARSASPEHPYFAAVRQELRIHRVDCALGLTPWDWSADLPNIVPVWDLEHRRKPYFPEVGDRQWENRERHYQQLLPKAIGVYTGTDAGKRQIQRFYGVDPEAISVIPFPTPSFALEAASAEEPDEPLPDGVPNEYLFYPAQYWPHKNHVRLFEALRILERRGARMFLVCCGADHGNLPHLRARAAALGVGEQVRFLDFVSRRQLIALYRRALAVPFVSYFGPDNLPPLEAGALGCPVIASAIEGSDEALGDTALYVNPDSAEDIAAAVWRIKTDGALRDRLVAAARGRASCRTVDHYAAALLKLLDVMELRFGCFR